MDCELGSGLMIPLKESIQQFKGSRDPASVRVIFALLAVAVAWGIYLMAGPRPWEDSIVKRLATGKSLKLEHFIQIGVWWGVAAGFLASLVALATVKWWSLPQAAVYPDLEPPSRRAVRWTWFFAAAAMLLAAWPRYARMDHSLWNDEEYHLRSYVLGEFTPTEEGRLTFKAVTWPEAIFLNEKGNHHIWASFENRLGHFLSGHAPGDHTFSEAGLRLVPFVSGILTVGTLVLLGSALGGPRAGLAAGLILALHPWHVRWSVEIRGYSTMLFAITAGLLCLVRALQTNRWRWWFGFAAAQALFLLCFAGSVYVVAAQNVVALLVIWRSGAPGTIRRGGAARLITAGIFSFIPTALVLGPHVPQLAAYLKSANEYAPIGVGWFTDLWTHLVTGLRPSGDPPGTSLGIALSDLTAAAPWKNGIVFGLIPLLTLGGLAALLRQDWRTRLVAGTLSLATLLAIVHNALSGAPFLTWYLLYLLPLFALSLVWAARGLMALHPRALTSLPLIFAVLFSLFTASALGKIMHIPRQPIREAVAAMRGSAPALEQADPKILTASFGDGARQMLSYDPRLRILKSPADLETLIQVAITSQQPLFLCLRGPAAMAQENPALLQAVTNDPRWQRLPSVLGMEAMLSYDLYRFAPESIGRLRLNP